MTFDPRTSSHSTGTSVRDAACYVLWSLARAFTKEDMAPHALALARQSVALAVADREVSIRRAGSAAFQENVGRMVRSLGLVGGSASVNGASLTTYPTIGPLPTWHRCPRPH